MQASETKLRQLIEGTKQYVVPLFQRPYSWSEKQWKVLWGDVLEQAQQGGGRPHFFGSIVTAPARSVPQGVGKYLLIDGQQRITTVLVLLAAVRDLADRSGDARLRDRIDGQYLTNAYEEDDERLKLLPTQDDRPSFRAILKRDGEAGSGRLRACYQFFSTRLEQLGADRLDRVHSAVVDRLSLVSITCDDHDNPHLIFESLNAKGEKLTPADLIRNFLLMRIHVGEQATLFKEHWFPIQQALGASLTEFVRHYLMKEGKILKDAEVYFELKDRLANEGPDEAGRFLGDLHRHGMFYAKFVDPTRESDKEVAGSLDRLHRLKVTVAYPFLLRVFDAYDLKALDRSQLIQTLEILESFVLRRSICNLPTNQLRRMLPPVFDAAGGAGPPFVENLRKELGGKRCPGDAAFVSALVAEPLYASADKNARLRLILERIEQSYDHKEPAELAKAQIEHVMPQTLTPEWRQELGEDADEHWSRLLHSLGNLTLTGYNPELSNKPYEAKRKAFAQSHYVLNRYFQDVPDWSPEAILERGRALAEVVVSIWSEVGGGPIGAASEKQQTNPPVAVRFRAERRSVTTWKDGFVNLLKMFDDSNPGLLKRIASENRLPALISTVESRFPRSRRTVGSVVVNTHASAAAFQEWCRKVGRAAGIDESEYEFLFADEPS